MHYWEFASVEKPNERLESSIGRVTSAKSPYIGALAIKTGNIGNHCKRISRYSY